MSDGYRRNGISIMVGHLPGRKRPVLMISNGNVIHAVAMFSNEEEGKVFLGAMEKLLEGMIEEEQEHE